MKELIKIQEKGGQRLVDGRELHQFLEVKEAFSDWLKRKIKRYNFTENVDYSTFQIFQNRGNNTNLGNKSTEYALTLDMAKELSMLQNNEKGRQARRYFIECEKMARELMQPQKPVSSLEIAKALIQSMEEQQKELAEVRQDVAQLKIQTATRPDYFTVVGYAILNHMTISLKVAANIGRRAAQYCREHGYPMDEVPDPRFGKVRQYPKQVLQTVFNSLIF